MTTGSVVQPVPTTEASGLDDFFMAGDIGAMGEALIEADAAKKLAELAELAGEGGGR